LHDVDDRLDVGAPPAVTVSSSNNIIII